MTHAEGSKATEDLTPFRVHSAREVARILSSMSTKHERLGLRASPTGETVFGTLVEVDDDAGVIVFEPEQDSEGTDRRLTEGALVDVEGSLDHVKITFESSVSGSDARYPQRLVMSFPDYVIRLQRREYYRVQVPSHPPVRCRIPGAGADGGELVTHVRNLSTGGAMLLDPTALFNGPLGTDYTGCILELPSLEAISCTLRLCNLYNVNADTASEGKILGMQFVDLSTRSLSVVQRYAAKLEVGQRSLGGR